MPSKSRKKIKGQARKAKAAAAAFNNNGDMVAYASKDGRLVQLNTSIRNPTCNHGQEELLEVCAQFVTLFYQLYIVNMDLNQVNIALKTAYDMHSEAVNNHYNREIVKKSIISNGVLSLLGQSGTNNLHMSFGGAIALMFIDSYSPSSPTPRGNFDASDPKIHMRNVDIINGCKRSLIKFFAKQTPCNCLDEMYSQVKSTTPKIAFCSGCKQNKERKGMYICTGCERIQYCSRACQMAHVPEHKHFCKKLQRKYG